MEFKIEKGIPFPAVKRTQQLDKMEIGDSFLIENKKKAISIRSGLIQYQKSRSKKFISETTDNGTRFWRTE